MFSHCDSSIDLLPLDHGYSLLYIVYASGIQLISELIRFTFLSAYFFNVTNCSSVTKYPYNQFQINNLLYAKSPFPVSAYFDKATH